LWGQLPNANSGLSEWIWRITLSQPVATMVAENHI
jgi:hypothetical protein